jgi:predicted RNA-binding Zn ribbon-like protein
LIGDFDGLMDWLVASWIIPPKRAEELGNEWRGTAEERKLLAGAHKLRAEIYHTVLRLAFGKGVPAASINGINEVLRHQTGYAELRRVRGGYEKRAVAIYTEPLQALAPIAESAADLLCYGDPSLIRKCESPDCVLYFYDRSKNHSRRWCSMSSCGNRAKAAAHYRRIQNEAN